MQEGDADPARRRFRRRVSDQNVPIMDAALAPLMAEYPDRVEPRSPEIEELRQIEHRFDVVLRRRLEASGFIAAIAHSQHPAQRLRAAGLSGEGQTEPWQRDENISRTLARRSDRQPDKSAGRFS